MSWLRAIMMLAFVLAAFGRPASASAFVAGAPASSEARVSAFELVALASVGASAETSPGLHEGIGRSYDENASGYRFAAGGAGEVTAAEIRALNRSLGGTTELTGNAETVIANMAYREGATARAATAIRDIAGRHLFDDANKRTAQAVAERLLGSGANPSQIRSVIDQVATGGLRTVEDIAAALGP